MSLRLAVQKEEYRRHSQRRCLGLVYGNGGREATDVGTRDKAPEDNLQLGGERSRLDGHAGNEHGQFELPRPPKFSRTRPCGKTVHTERRD